MAEARGNAPVTELDAAAPSMRGGGRPRYFICEELITWLRARCLKRPQTSATDLPRM